MGKSRERCCQIDCEKYAEWKIYADGAPDTAACTKHVGELLTDAKEHRVFRIEESINIPDDIDPEYEAMKADLTQPIPDDGTLYGDELSR